MRPILWRRLGIAAASLTILTTALVAAPAASAVTAVRTPAGTVAPCGWTAAYYPTLVAPGPVQGLSARASRTAQSAGMKSFVTVFWGLPATGSLPVTCYQVVMRSLTGTTQWIGFRAPYPWDPPGTQPQPSIVFWPVPVGTYVIQVSAWSGAGWGPAATTGVSVR